MNYNLKIAGKDVPVQCDLKDDGTLSAALGNDRFEARFTVISPNHIHLVVSGQGMNVYLADDPWASSSTWAAPPGSFRTPMPSPRQAHAGKGSRTSPRR